MKNILILNGSARKNAYTSALIDSFIKGIEINGHKAIVFNLRDMNIHNCIGCLNGGKDSLHPCVQSDDMDYIYEEFRKSDIVVFATPLFFWSYSGLIKNAIDRMWALAEGEVDELHGNNKSGILLIAAGGCHPEPLIEHFNYLMQRLSWKNMGCVSLKHTDDMDIDNISTIKEAYEMGLSIS